MDNTLYLEVHGIGVAENRFINMRKRYENIKLKHMFEKL